MSSVYSNFPYRESEVWVMGHPDQSNKGWKFLFKAKAGQIKYYEKIAWNPTDFERAIKQKCREIRKLGEYKHFEFCDWLDMRRYMENGRANLYKDWPLNDLEELRR